MDFRRLFRHSTTTLFAARRYFPEPVMARIEAAIRESERKHSCQICFAYETSLNPISLLRRVSARARALQIFSNLKVWDTECNNGILIYLLLADRQVEIVADRGVHRLVPEEAWRKISEEMTRHFAMADFEKGLIAGISGLTEQVTPHFPASSNQVDELPDRPVRV